jgi:hypothetical protein
MDTDKHTWEWERADMAVNGCPRSGGLRAGVKLDGTKLRQIAPNCTTERFFILTRFIPSGLRQARRSKQNLASHAIYPGTSGHIRAYPGKNQKIYE